MYTKLRKIRKENDVSAIDMANLIQLKTAAAYFKKENGHIKFSLDEAIKISRYFKMPIEAIFFDD